MNLLNEKVEIISLNKWTTFNYIIDFINNSELFENSYNIIANTDMYFDETIKMSEDFPLWLKSTFNNNKLYFMPTQTVAYRVSENSLTDTFNEKFNEIYYKEILKYFQIYFKILHPFHFIHFRINYFIKFRTLRDKKNLFKYLRIFDLIWIINKIKKIKYYNLF
jgi:hypothetical protein